MTATHSHQHSTLDEFRNSQDSVQTSEQSKRLGIAWDWMILLTRDLLTNGLHSANGAFAVPIENKRLLI